MQTTASHQTSEDQKGQDERRETVWEWYVLRRYFARSGWWIARATFAPWLGHIVLRILPAGDRTYMASAIISLLVYGFFYGVATWAVLVVISRQPFASVESE